MGFWRQRLIIVILIGCSVVVTVAAQVGVPVGWLSIPAGLVLSFFAPGYAALMAFRTPRRPVTTTDLALSIPLSFSAAIILGVVLDFTPIGLHLQPMAIGLALATLVLLAVAVRRDIASDAYVAPTGPAGVGPDRQARRAGPIEGLIRASLIGALVVAALWASYGIIRAAQDRPPQYTELYVQQAAPFTPVKAAPSQAELLVGVNNREAQAITYTLKVVAHYGDNSPDLLVSQQQVTVQAGANWQGHISTPVRCTDSVEAQLFLPGDPQPYRSVQARFPCDTTPTPAVTVTATPAK